MSNRLAELETYLTSLRPPKTRTRRARRTAGPGAVPPGAPTPDAGLTTPVARSLTAVDYTVPGIVPAIAQPSSMVCWATVSTMMISWKDNQSVPIEAAMDRVGRQWGDKVRANQGLLGSEKPVFLAAAGFIAEPPQSLSIDGWESMLRRYGPIWVTTDEAPGAPWAIHARIIRGIHGDGTAGGTALDIVDPAGGRAYTESFARLVQRYEEEARDRTRPLRIQIVHWPSDTGRTVQQSLRSAETLGWAYGAPAQAQDVIGGIGLGLAVFQAGAAAVTAGDIRLEAPEVVNYIHPNTPLDTPTTQASMEIAIRAHHPRYFIDTQTFVFNLVFEHNRYDIKAARITVNRARSSELNASSFNIRFRANADSQPNEEQARVRFLIDGRWDPVGRGDVNFTGELRILADGSARISISSEQNWVWIEQNAFQNIRRTPVAVPRRTTQAFEVFFNVNSDRIEPGTERAVLNWYDGLDAEVRRQVRDGTTPVQIIGHASTTGTDTYNRELGRRRAERVSTMLRDHIGPNARLEARSEGERGTGPDGVEDRARRKVRVEISRFTGP